MLTVRSVARRQQLVHGLDLLVVDYLQLIDVDARRFQENRVQEVSYVSRQLKALARELGCPIIAISQLSRNVENRVDKRPILADLRESGSIEQDADSVLMLYREGYYNEDCDDPKLTDLYIRKNRQGPTGHVELRFDHERMCFENVDRTRSTPVATAL